MRSKLAAVAVLAVTVLAGAAESSQAHEAKSFRCSLRVFSQTPTSLQGFDFGLVTCSEPFGKGVQFDTYIEAVTAQKASAHGPFTWFFADGSVHGTFGFAGTFSSPTTATFAGTLQLTRGTARFKHVHANGHITCTTTDAGQTFTCTVAEKGTGMNPGL